MTLTLSGSAGITNPQGTAQTPAIGIGTNTAGIYWPNAAIMGFTVNGAEAMRVDQQGNVLIGTTTNLTGSVLTVRNFGSNSRALAIGDTNTASASTGLYFYTTSTANIAVGAGGALTFTNNGGSTEVMRITSTGNLGIGTATVAAGNAAAIYGGNLYLASAQISLPSGTGNVAVQGVSTNIVSGLAQATTSGTAISFLGIPLWVRRVIINISGVKPSGSSSYMTFRIGSGSFVSTGYVCGTTGAGASSVSSVNYTDGFAISAQLYNAAALVSGALTLTLLNASTNLWVATGIFSRSDAVTTGFSSGSIALSGVLDRVQLTINNGTDTFTAGSINILYE